MKKFDLNIEKILEHWEIHNAIREVISNSIDEQRLTNSKEIEIFKDKNDNWHIRDYGRGINYTHLTQKENDEKLKNADLVIGKFGIGLKDALATFHRKNIGIKIKSKYGQITIGMSQKPGFEMKTLHAFIEELDDSNFVGTDVILENCKDEHIKAAKDFFLMFSDEKLLEETKIGEIYEKGKKNARIYIGGLLVAEEENFLFSYNLTSITKPMRKALNRERTNVGRTAYSKRVNEILLFCKSEKVADLLTADLSKFDSGGNHDELQWIDVSVHACKLLNPSKKVVFLTSQEMFEGREMVDKAKDEGYVIIIIPETVKEKIRGTKDYKGNPIRDLGQYTKEWNESFEFKFVDEEDLSKSEREIFYKTDKILGLVGGKPKNVNKILISETMRLETAGYSEAAGLWEESHQRIIIKRDQLKDLKSYAGTLLHEIAHARSSAVDISREFEDELTALLGIISEKNLS